MKTRYKTRLFLGSVNYTADNKFNKWIINHPDITIIKFRYEQARLGDHSICILYEEEYEE